MSGKWFSNRGQVLQTTFAAISAFVALIALYFVLKGSNSLPGALTILYISAATFLLLVGILIGRHSTRATLAGDARLPESQRSSERSSALGASAPVNIHVSPTISPQFSQNLTQEKRAVAMGTKSIDERPRIAEAKILPNIGCLHPERADIVLDHSSDVWERSKLWEGEIENVPAILIPFSNEPQSGKKTLPADGLKARLTYYERDGIQQLKRIDSGCWLNEAYRFTDLEVGGIAYLIGAVRIGDHTGIVSNPRHSAARYSEDTTLIDHLPKGNYDLKVDLIAGDHGEYSATFWFELDAEEELQMRRSDPGRIPRRL
jgi:hypothetical protein